MGAQVLEFGGGEQRGGGRGDGVEGEDVVGVGVDLLYTFSICPVSRNLEQEGEKGRVQTLPNRALKKLLTRNLNRSTSVCTTMRRKFVFGSMFPVWSSTSSIYAFVSTPSSPLSLPSPSPPKPQTPQK